jgi:hypothetical protein
MLPEHGQDWWRARAVKLSPGAEQPVPAT